MKKLFEMLIFPVIFFAFSGSLYSKSIESSSDKLTDKNTYNPQFTSTAFSDTNRTQFHEISTANSQNLAFQSNISQDEKQESTFRIFPNPATDKLFVRFHGWEGEKDIKFLDITGRIVLHLKSVDENTEIDISALPKGIYLIHAKNTTLYVVSKLKIQ